MKTSYSSAEVYDGLAKGGSEQEMVTRWLFSRRGWTNIAQKVLLDMGTQKSQLDDVIQEGVIDLIIDIRLRKVKDKTATKSFFIQSCKNIWLNLYNRKVRGSEIIREQYADSQTVAQELSKSDQEVFWKKIDALLDQIGRKCKEVLKLWASGFNHEEIAEKIGYESANVSKKTKSLCIRKLKSLGLKKEDWTL